ncbi:methionyl-tRNA formyltransferase [Cyanobacterium stanieri LEGE 03274]|uniref:Methionyl-tRNA formyltransferase n=1 Tax=Cyanobacterium stanieri LEGE 03274 TaxID=1828756 RepID=A0ABR9V4C8_9CHRO|nr:methionyl-tRNA formyltransferase [Cyanobacterium stanieri]MBE9222697.1 methionyl-tRNA formyltransferase [Cyanobacterium stanieri LEGE 03274]
MRIVFFGTPDFAVATLEKLLNDNNHQVIAVVTQPDKRRGRGSKMIPSAVKKTALQHNLPIWQPHRIKKDQTTLQLLQQSQADVFVVVAYGQILSSQILQMPKYGCINVHGSILPEYRGAAPIQWSIYDGKQETGITTMLMDEGMDTGAMLLKAYTPISLLENSDTLAEKLATQGAQLLLQTLAKLPDIKPTPQDDALATHARLINKEDYLINWKNSAGQIHNQIRAFYPNCFTTFRQQKLKICNSIPLQDIENLELPPELLKIKSYLSDIDSVKGEVGEIVKTVKNFGFIVQTGSGLLLILEVQLAGKKLQSAWNFINGTHLQLGEFLS